ncbi:MAG: hypothetical protein KDD47_23965 [Acidobacteria bacterium]|nr:hypothetical protein [Acidobacteriota bacterium]
MQRSVVLSLLSLTLFFLAFPLTLSQPGAPAGLKADESAYYLMALSLAHDQDLQLRAEDTERVFREFPFRWVPNLIVMTDDGWQTAFYGKPYIYPLFAAPFAALFGARGLLFFNMALMTGMVWLGTAYLRRFNGDGTSALFSGLFFLLSSAFAYVFWIQTEVFNMAAIFLALYLGFRPDEGAAEGRPWRPLLSGAVLALAVYNKPMFAALALPLLFVDLPGRRWRRMGAWVLGFSLGLGAVAGLAVALTGHATPYLGVVRQGVTICEPGVMPIEPVAAEPTPEPTAEPSAATQAARQAASSPTGNAWSWLFRVPQIDPALLAENVGYFLWGRHTGFFLYMPFAALAVLFFLLHGRRSGARWVLMASLALVALYFLVFIYFNWHGGGGFIGNRYFVSLYPAFLFLVKEVRPKWPLALVSGLAGLFLSPILFTPLNSLGPEPTLQHHVRSFPYRFFPLELSLRNVPGYQREPFGEGRVVVRKDQALVFGEQLWLRAADRVELWWITTEPLGKTVFQINNLALKNTVRLELEGAEEELHFRAGEETRRIELQPQRPGRIRSHPEGKLFVYRLTVTTESGRVRTWTRHNPPSVCPAFAQNLEVEDSFPVGIQLTYLGDGAALDADLYELEWGPAQVPAEAAPRARLEVPVSLTNRSAHAWPNRGPARVKLAYHWRGEDGEMVDFEGRRTELPAPVPPGASVEVPIEVVAPPAPGIYQLEIDPVYEHVAWFSQKNGGDTLRATVEVRR